jgi:hypothetical protein
MQCESQTIDPLTLSETSNRTLEFERETSYFFLYQEFLDQLQTSTEREEGRPPACQDCKVRLLCFPLCRILQRLDHIRRDTGPGQDLGGYPGAEGIRSHMQTRGQDQRL